MARAWTDARGQAALEFGTRLTKIYPPANCFCDNVHTDAYIYFNEGEYYDAATRTPIKDMGENGINPNNCVVVPPLKYYVSKPSKLPSGWPRGWTQWGGGAKTVTWTWLRTQLLMLHLTMGLSPLSW